MKSGKINHQHEYGTGTDSRMLNKQLEVPFTRTKADVWAEMDAKLDAAPKAKAISLFARPAFRLAIAASVVLLVGLVGVMRFYSTSVNTLAGQHLVVDLPDGSVVQLNAASSLSYHPYWWRFSRDLSFDGEAYFEVEKGSRFRVSSSKGTTTVLGTSFNIYSRDETYRVACLTGKVGVTDRQKQAKVILTPNEMAELNASGVFDVHKNAIVSDETAWIDNKFIFTSTPLKEVFEEIERQYGVRILGKEEFKRNYTGNFDRDQNIEQVLDFVCKAFGIKFDKINATEYRLTN